MPDEQLPFTTHLEELRKRLMIAGGAWLVAFFACYAFAEPLFRYISEPVRAALPAGSSLVFITATEPFFTYMKIAALAALIVSLPVILWQFWAFVAPGLYTHEKRFAISFVSASCLCFGAGSYFGFTYIFPTIFAMLIKFGIGASDVNAMLSMGSYLSLAALMLLAFGLIAEVPIVILILARMGVIDHLWLKRNRKYMVIVAFIFAAIVTPGPDVISQVSLAIPFILLYEVGIVLARFFGKKKAEEETAGEESPASE
ncbi:MAG TPA: twin-arginine translocase subunit TatC [Desulfuromonadales bacterium]|nr:twin-arginine translocase subunit TatC [Desulfuromonadales bacterium]